MEKHPICISRTIQYSKNFIGTPCIIPSLKPSRDYPFYVSSKKISINYIKRKGVCDVGLFNLLRTFNKLPIPGKGNIDFYPEGSMDAWVYILRKKLIKYKKNFNLPAGTLLFSNNHMALLLKKKKILHCNYKKGKVCVEDLIIDFDYFCLPKNWILTE